MFYIRADGNEKIGMGHIMRCLTIAEAVRAQGESVCFILADDKPEQVIRERGFETKILFTYYDEMDVELPQLVLLLGMGGGKPTLLVDSYYVTKFYLQNLRLVSRVFLMDDMKTDIFPCDGLINYNIYAQELSYESDYPEDTELLLGPSFMPLRAEFLKHCDELNGEKAGGEADDDLPENAGIRTEENAGIRTEENAGIRTEENAEIRTEEDVEKAREGAKLRILLTTGGGDACHMEITFLRYLADKGSPLLDYDWQVVCGPFSPDSDELLAFAAHHTTVRVLQDVKEMAPIMKECDLAVSAAGSTLYELAAMGIPTVGFYFVENQRRNMETFGKRTPVMNAGDFSVSPEYTMEFIERNMTVLSENEELRVRISEALRTLVDGKGAQRLAQRLVRRDGC